MSGNNGTTQNGPVSDTDQYGYVPSKTLAVIFVALFVLSTLAHITQAIKHRVWFMFFTAVLCGLIESVGWVGRGWSGFSPLLSLPFEIQIVATIVAPTPLIAANFVIFGRLIRQLGQKYSRLSPRLYTVLFTCGDVICLVIQGLGGGVAGSADTLDGANRGARIMLVGIVIQLIIIMIFTGLAVEYLLHHMKDVSSGGSYIGMDKGYSNQRDSGPGEFTPNLQMMTKALAFNLTCLFIRAIYRTIELSGGWRGKVLRTQVYFIVFDGAMVVLALYTTNIVHPGVYLQAPAPKATMTRLQDHHYPDNGEV